jgi:hypothetical protein
VSIPADQYGLYAEFGIAAEKAQALELEAGNVAISFLLLLENTDQLSAERRKNIPKHHRRYKSEDIRKSVEKHYIHRYL